jgi:Fur family peroxide stress response transcriptional regulator
MVIIEMDAQFQQRFDQMLSRLKANRLRVTPQRLAVLKILASSSEHPTVEAIHEQVRKKFPTTSLATVYKTVSVLKKMNEILELGFPDGSNRYDGKRPYPHPHMICTKCREILDPDLAILDELTEEMGEKTGYKILSHRLDFFGLCPKCQGG